MASACVLVALMASSVLASPAFASPMDAVNKAVDDAQQKADDAVGQNPADPIVDGAQDKIGEVGGSLGGVVQPILDKLPPLPDVRPPMDLGPCPVGGMDACSMVQGPPMPSTGPSPPSDPGTTSAMPTPGDLNDKYAKPSVSDTDDDAHHRARFSLDRNWVLSGATLNALSLTGPEDTLVSVQWAYDQSPIGNGPVQGAAVPFVATRAGNGFDAIRITPYAPGLHHVTLTASWNDGGQTFYDRVTTPLYVEDPAIVLVHQASQAASWKPDANDLVDAAKSGDVGALTGAVTGTATGVLQTLSAKPTIMLVSDFLGKEPGLTLALGPDPVAIQSALAALPDTDGLDPAAGFGDVLYDGATTQLGAPVDRIGLTMAHSLVDTGLANVIFVSGIDSKTGALNRGAIQNGLIFAKVSGLVDAVVWGLPASAYQPAIVADSLRPDFNFPQTPMVPVPAGAPLPASSPDWHTETGVSDGDNGVNSIMDSLNDQAALLDIQPGPEGNVADLLYNHIDEVYARYRILVETMRNDLRFDAFLQNHVLALSGAGVPVVVPSEACPGMADESMTVIGLSQVVGTITVADGTGAGPNPAACKGPDRRAAAHGTGIDFVADPRPGKTTATSLAKTTKPIPYEANSLGAASRVAFALGQLRRSTVTSATPYTARDLAGMLATTSTHKDGIGVWSQGNGFVDTTAPPTTEPAVFARGTSLVFSPFDLQAGRTTAVADLAITGAANVQLAMTAPEELWTVTGRTEQRFLVDEAGNKVTQDLATTDFGHLSVALDSVKVTKIDATHAEARLVLSASPSVLSGGPGVGNGGNGNSLPDVREYLLPGLYSGHTWISTPAGIIQLPINLGVGTILDVHRFLAPNTPVPEDAVCLEPPFQKIGELTGLRHTAHELEELNVCIYFTNTDHRGVARFYTPLPLPYTLTSWFDGIFRERGDAIGKVYPHVKRDITVPAPIDLAAISNAPPGVSIDPGITSGAPPTIAADLPYPLAYVPMNVSIPVAIAVHWRYRDNQETDHFLPVPNVDIPEFVYLLTGGIIPRPLISRADEALRLGRENVDGTLQYANEHLGPILDDAQSKAKAPPTGIATIDQLLGQPLSKALPTNLAPDPSACQFGYGNALNPAITPEVAAALADPANAPKNAAGIVAAAKKGVAEPATFPDTLVMRARPTLDSLLGLGSQLPICMADYPFNIPQPNTYPTFITNEFDLHLEATILVVCVETVADVECFVIVPGPPGSGNLLVQVSPDMLVASAADAATGAIFGGPDRLEQNLVQALPTLQLPPFDPLHPMESIPTAPVDLPAKVNLVADGRVSLKFEVNAGEGDHGYLHYIAIPLPLLASGYLDPLVAALKAQGVDPLTLLDSTGMPDGTPPAVADLGSLLRDSAEDLLRVQPIVEIKRADMFLNAWWWTDSFFDARIFPTALLPRATTTDCLRDWKDTIHLDMTVPRYPADPADPTCRKDKDGNIMAVSGSADTPNGRPADFQNGDFNLGEDFWWLTHPNVNLQLFERGRTLWDPYTLQPDPDKMAAVHYPWKQAEFFENVLEFWDDEHVRDITPNEMHIHSPDLHTHHAVEYTKHCTNEKRYDTLTGALLNDPQTGQFCFKGLLAYNEGDKWLENSNDASGSGIYDPDLGLDGVGAITLSLIDTVGEGVSSTNQLVWAAQVPPLFGTQTLGDVVDGSLGVDPAELQWWNRGQVPTANRRIYSDMYTNSSFMLSEHDKYCEELADFTTDNAFLDLFPRWRMTCPWQAGADAQAAYGVELTATGGKPRFLYGFVPDDPAHPRDANDKLVGHWDWQFRVPEMGTKSPDTKARYTRMDSANAYQDALEPLFLNGTYERRDDVYGDCMGMPVGSDMDMGSMDGMSGMDKDGWPCTAMNPMEQAAHDLAELDQDAGTPFVDPVDPKHPTITNPFRYALGFYGLDMMSFDEAYATVPLPSNPDHWFGTDPDATEWNGFFRNLRLRELDANPADKAKQETSLAILQDEMTDLAPLLRAWLAGDVEGVKAWYANPPAWFTASVPATGPAALADAMPGENPFWKDVHGKEVPYTELTRMRMSSDPEMPMCDGLFFLGACHMQHDNLDAGDLSLYGKGHLFGRTDKPKMTYIPQGSTFSRWNRAHVEAVGMPFVPNEVRAIGQATPGSCGDVDGRSFWLLAPTTLDPTTDGWMVGGQPSPTDAAPPGLQWSHQEGVRCVPLPWERWSYYAEYTSDQPAGGPEDAAAEDVMMQYYTQAGIPTRDAADPHHMALTVQSTYTYPDPAHPTMGVDGGCWFDPSSLHSSTPHVEMDVFDVRFYERFDWQNAGHYTHVEPGKEPEPVPATPYGAYCPPGTDEEKARFEREYIPLRLPLTMNGGEPARTLAAPVTVFAPEAGTPADIVGLGIGSHLLPKIVRAVLEDGVDIVDSKLPHLDLHVDQELRKAEKTVGAAVPAEVQQILDGLAPNLPQGQVVSASTGSPIRPIERLDVSPQAIVSELVVEHRYAFPKDTYGIFVASLDNGATWAPLPARGAPGFVGSTDGNVHLAFLDLSAYAGKSVVVGSEIVGAAWTGAQWDVLDTVPLASGLGPMPAGRVAPAGSFAMEYHGAADNAALQALHGRALLAAPLVVAKGETLALDGVDLVAAQCGEATCGIVVDGTLSLAHGLVAPLDDGGAVPIQVTGTMALSDCQVGGLANGLQVLGGTLTVTDCYFVGTGAAGIVSALGHVEVSDSVFSGQTLGVYALGSQVRLERDLFVHMGRSAALLDESWGTVRDSLVLHARQAGFLWRGPLGGSDMAFLGNNLEDVGTGIGASFALADRLAGLGTDASVPVEARSRIQGNAFQWNTLEAIGAGPLSAPVAYGNAVTHSDIGALVGWLDPAVLEGNTLYTNENGWQDAATRTQPRQDGNLWTGLWQMGGLTMPVDATRNHWGPGAIEAGTQWPSDIVSHTSQVETSFALPSPVQAPYKAILTAPGYAGGQLAGLSAQDLQAELTAGGDRKVPVMVDVANGIDSVTVEGTFYSSGLPAVADQGTLADLLNNVAPGYPANPLPAEAVRTTTITVPVKGTHAAFTFTFDDAKEAYADWKVLGMGSSGSPITPGMWATKSVRVHNAVAWPILADLGLLVQGLAYDALDDGLAATRTTMASTLLPTGAQLAAAGMPVTPMDDGTVPLSGSPALVALARDQDPVRAYEFRYTSSTDPDAKEHELATYGADRVMPLPKMQEGETLHLQGRATDASGLTSPWMGLDILADSSAPSVTVPGPCISDHANVHYKATESPPAGFGLRASGLSTIHLLVEKLDADGNPLSPSWSRTFDGTLAGDEDEGAWHVPDAGAGVYRITAAATDHAGQAGTFTGVFLIDAGGPKIEPAQTLTTLAGLTGGYLGDLPATLLGPAPGKDLPVAAAIDDSFGCGIVHVDAQIRVEQGDWQTLFAADYDSPQKTADLPSDLTTPLDALDGSHFEVRIEVDDAGGNHVVWSSGLILSDYGYPTLQIQPAPPVCANAGTLHFVWGATDADPVGPQASGLGAATLTVLRSDLSVQVLQAPLSIGDKTWSGAFDFTPPGAGVYTFVLATHDQAGNAAEQVFGPTLVDTVPPQIDAAPDLSDLVGRTYISASDLLQGATGVDLSATVQDAAESSCGLALAALELSTNQGATWNALQSLDHPDEPATVQAPLSLAGYDGSFVRLRVRAMDGAGNEATWPDAPLDTLVDATPPQLGQPPNVPQAVPTSFEVAWTAVDPPGGGGHASGIAYVMWSLIPGSDPDAAPQSYGIGASAKIDLDGLAYGPYVLRLTVVDVAGNMFTWHASFSFDPSAPVPAPSGGSGSGGSGAGSGSAGSGGAIPSAGEAGDAASASATVATDGAAATADTAGASDGTVVETATEPASMSNATDGGVHIVFNATASGATTTSVDVSVDVPPSPPTPVAALLADLNHALASLATPSPTEATAPANVGDVLHALQALLAWLGSK